MSGICRGTFGSRVCVLGGLRCCARCCLADAELFLVKQFLPRPPPRLRRPIFGISNWTRLGNEMSDSAARWKMKLANRRKLVALFLLLGSGVSVLLVHRGWYHFALLLDIGLGTSGEIGRLIEMPTAAELHSDARIQRVDLTVAMPSGFRDESADGFTSFSNDELFVTVQVNDMEVVKDTFALAHAATGKKYISWPVFRRDCYSTLISSANLFVSKSEAQSVLYLRNIARLSGMLEVTRAEYFSGSASEGLLELHKDGTLTYSWQLRDSEKSGVIHFRSGHGDVADMDLVRSISQSVSAAR